MSSLDEQIPEALQPEVDAALDWYNATEASEFHVTGVLDAEATLAGGYPRPLRLVLCSGEECRQETFSVDARSDDVTISLATVDPPDSPAVPPAELDPPPGPRRAWLEAALARHAFVVLVFYRGFW